MSREITQFKVAAVLVRVWWRNGREQLYPAEVFALFQPSELELIDAWCPIPAEAA
jgi:hypothetical protein